MAYLKHFSLMLGAAAVVAGVNLPAQADSVPAATEAVAPALELTQTNLGEEASAPADVSVAVEPAEAADLAAPQGVGSEASLLLPEASTLADGVFEAADIDAVLAAATVETTPEATTDSLDLAQSTGGAYGGVAPAYLGIGGNLGIVADSSAVGDFGFTVLSKISLGPRFALRPSFIFSENYTSLTIPLTYNFNTASLAGFRFQPYVGAGVDIPFGEDVGVLIDAGADIPISRDFTINTAANMRVSGGFGLGLSVGVGYNFPFIFE
jgi:hypothetical protein